MHFEIALRTDLFQSLGVSVNKKIKPLNDYKTPQNENEDFLTETSHFFRYQKKLHFLVSLKTHLLKTGKKTKILKLVVKKFLNASK